MSNPYGQGGHGTEDWTRHEYDWDRGGFSGPRDSYGAPGDPYGAPGDPYGDPGDPYGDPGDPYGAPGDAYGRPHDSYGSEGWERRGHPGDPVLGQSRDMSPGEEKTWAVLAHVAAPIATLLSAGWLGFVAPLLIWVFFRGRSEFVRVAAARSFNFNLLLFLANAAAWLLFFSIIGIPFAIAIWIGAFIGMLVFHISAAMDAGRGILYRYPISVPILR